MEAATRSHRTAPRLAGVQLLVVVLAATFMSPGPASPDPSVPAPNASPFGNVPLRFEVNRGQTHDDVRFLARAPGYTAFFTEREVVFAMSSGAKKGPELPRPAIRLRPVGAEPSPEIRPIDRLKGVSNYFNGPKVVTGAPSFGKVRYDDVWPGIDVLFYEGPSGGVEYDVIVAAGVDPSRARFDIKGAEDVAIDSKGELRIETAIGPLTQRAPVASQGDTAVASAFRLNGTTISFDVGAYDASRELVIDPELLAYSTFLGGSQFDEGRAIEVDASGAAIVTGTAGCADFPVTSGVVQPTFGGGCADAFVTKFTPDGSALVFSTFLGGSDPDTGNALALANDGIYVVGASASVNFPVTSGAFQSSMAGVVDGYVAKLALDGTALAYSTYLGGEDFDDATGVAVQGSVAHVTGSSASASFPTTPGAFQPSRSGSSDAYVAAVSASGASLIYSTYLGGSGGDGGSGIVVDGSGLAYVTGFSSSINFPTTPGAFQTVPGGANDVVVTKINSTGTALIYSTYVGGSGVDLGNAIARAGGEVFVTGLADASFPTTAGAFQTASNGEPDGFVLRLNSAGTALVFSSLLGGDDYDEATTIDLSAAAAHVGGFSASADFPVCTAPGTPVGCEETGFQTSLEGGANGFVTELSHDGSRLVSSTYIGGSDFDRVDGVAVDATGTYLTGSTFSSDFDVCTGRGTPIGCPGPAFDTSVELVDGFVTKLRDPIVSVSNAVVTEGDSGTRNAIFRITLSEASSAPVSVHAHARVSSARYVDIDSRRSATVTFAPGETSKPFAVAVKGDLIDEPNERFLVRLSRPTSRALIGRDAGIGTIRDNDPPPAMSISDVRRTEGTGGRTSFVFTVTLSKRSEKNVGATFVTANGSAVAGSDYVGGTGRVSFRPTALRTAGPRARTFAITVVGDNTPEPNETFRVSLVKVTNATLRDGSAIGTIVNDDGGSVGELG